MTRSLLYALLRNEAVERGARIEYGKRLQAVEETPDGVTARFDDGTAAAGHLMVGADGLRSAVRPQSCRAGRCRTQGLADGARLRRPHTDGRDY
ncbi:FAD-dependent monooxygenase [Arthrobacter sp. ISL-5]|uniref:FAD-dependent monooxygenase n=1 Tax=Arthrobacter sp. ISL-5 TaxID=2819111 RepID=UPI001BEC70A7|nr:FAD-dependent monooxygenase [Arthrobacter sp. ISL-5]